MREPIRTYASVFTYIRISLHVRTHKPARIYVIVSGSVYILCRDLVRLSPEEMVSLATIRLVLRKI
jgi:hypothetical protein